MYARTWLFTLLSCWNVYADILLAWRFYNELIALIVIWLVIILGKNCVHKYLCKSLNKLSFLNLFQSYGFLTIHTGFGMHHDYSMHVVWSLNPSVYFHIEDRIKVMRYLFPFFFPRAQNDKKGIHGILRAHNAWYNSKVLQLICFWLIAIKYVTNYGDLQIPV